MRHLAGTLRKFYQPREDILRQLMSPVPFIEIDDPEFQLGRFLRANWFLFIFISLFAALSVFLTVLLPEPGQQAAMVHIFGIEFNLQEICVASSVLITFVGSFTALWAAFAEPRDKPIFYYFIGIESFKRLVLIIPLFVMITSLSLWISLKFPKMFMVIFSVVAFCLGIVVFSTLLVYISRTTRIKKIIFTTIGYSLVIFLISLFFLLSIDLTSIATFYVPILFFVYALGTAAVFYVIITLIFELIIPLFKAR